MTIRKATDVDFDSIFEVVNDSATAYQGVIPPDRYHVPYMTREHLRGEISSGVIFWVFEDDDRRILGVMGLQDTKDVTLIRHAYVRTTNRGSGIGGALLEHLLALSSRPVLIGTWAAAEWAIRFYEKHGFFLVTSEEKDALLKEYWNIPGRQVETSVVLVDARYRTSKVFGDTI